MTRMQKESAPLTFFPLSSAHFFLFCFVAPRFSKRPPFCWMRDLPCLVKYTPCPEDAGALVVPKTCRRDVIWYDLLSRKRLLPLFFLGLRPRFAKRHPFCWARDPTCLVQYTPCPEDAGALVVPKPCRHILSNEPHPWFSVGVLQPYHERIRSFVIWFDFLAAAPPGLFFLIAVRQRQGTTASTCTWLHRGASGARAFSLASCAAGDFFGLSASVPRLRDHTPAPQGRRRQAPQGRRTEAYIFLGGS
jgi:hypothetical protein